MNNESTLNNVVSSPETPGDDDEVLGAAIASAIRARVDAPVDAPPASLIAGRAEAHARARVVQRTVVGVAASVMLLAGGLVAYRAFDADPDSVTVAGETTTPSTDTSASVPPQEATPPDEEATPPDVEGTPPDVAAPSALAWTEFDSGDLEIYQAETVGDGRVVARAHSGTGTEIVVSENGADWTGVNVPEGVAVDFIDLSSPRWLIGQASGSNPAGAFFYSDDEGRNWTELTFDPALEGEPLHALTSATNMVIVSRVPADRTAHGTLTKQLIAAQGLVADGATLESWAVQGNTISFTIADSDASYSFEISDEQREALEAAEGDTQIRMYASDGGTATAVADYVSWNTSGSSDAAGFHIVVTTPDDELLLSSPDGTDWTETSIDQINYPAAYDAGLLSTNRDGRWVVESYDGTIRVKSLGRLDDPESATATMRDVADLTSFATAQAGMVAVAYTAAPGPARQQQIIGWSTDGTDWVWQTLAEAFGLDEAEASVELAVGDEFVLARVTAFKPDYSGNLEAQPPEWFTATPPITRTPTTPRSRAGSIDFIRYINERPAGLHRICAVKVRPSGVIATISVNIAARSVAFLYRLWTPQPLKIQILLFKWQLIINLYQTMSRGRNHCLRPCPHVSRCCFDRAAPCRVRRNQGRRGQSKPPDRWRTNHGPARRKRSCTPPY